MEGPAARVRCPDRRGRQHTANGSVRYQVQAVWLTSGAALFDGVGHCFAHGVLDLIKRTRIIMAGAR
jgi:hypothetical protein